MNPAAPITISFANAQPDDPRQGDDYARWKTEDSPKFPKPMCLAIAPKQPSRQTSDASSLNCGSDHSYSVTTKTAAEGKATILFAATTRSPPARNGAFRIRRMLQIAKASGGESQSSGIESPPQQPNRQLSKVNIYTSDSCRSIMNSSQAESVIDEEEALEGTRSVENSNNEEAAMEESIRDLSPSRPQRQHTGEAPIPAAEAQNSSIEDIVLIMADGSGKYSEKKTAAVQEPAWVKLWESQADGDSSRSNFWEL